MEPKFTQVKTEVSVRDTLKEEAKRRGMTLYGLMRYCANKLKAQEI